jgi:RNA polymerase sigma factor (sigma-70 family)
MDEMDHSAALTDRLAADLDGTFPDFVLDVQDGLYSGALRLTGNRSDAEDIAQETLTRAYRALREYPAERIRALRIRGWVWTIAANLCRNRARRRSRKPELPLFDTDVATRGEGPEGAALSRDTRDRLAALVAELPWAQRAGVVLRHVVGLTYAEVAEAHPDIQRDMALVDALTMWFVKNPEWFDVVVASNLFGDIVTDLGAMLQGGMGFAAGGNIDPERRYPSMFEPIHGSAPKYTGQKRVNPIASVEAVRMMLDHLGEHQAADAVGAAVGAVLAAGEVRTKDIGGDNTTDEVGEAIVALI